MFTRRIVLAALVLGARRRQPTAASPRPSARGGTAGAQSPHAGSRRVRGKRRRTNTPDLHGVATHGAAGSLTLWLDPYREYRLVGVCDDDCDDLDFELFDNRARIVDEDVAADALAMVVVQTRDRARYRLKISMASCSTSPCWYTGRRVQQAR